MNQEKKWKRGDIGPDGRVFWGTIGRYKKPIFIEHAEYEEKIRRKLELKRKSYSRNKISILKKKSTYYKLNKDRISDYKKKYWNANKQVISKKNREWRENNQQWIKRNNKKYYKENKDFLSEKKKSYYQQRIEYFSEKNREYRDKNRSVIAESKRRYTLKISFSKADGSSLDAWWNSLAQHTHTSRAIFALQPDPGQTLAELIHELSGYSMEVCEQIANPPALELETTAETAPEPPPAFNPDDMPF